MNGERMCVNGEGGVLRCVADKEDDNYFYYLCLNGRYSRSSCPSYLKPEGFQALKSAERTNTFKLHTDTILKLAISDIICRG